MTDLADLTLVQTADLIRNRQVSPVELMEATLRRIAETEPLIHAFAWIGGGEALDSARQVEDRLKSGVAPRPLEGIPIGVKDLLYTQGIPTEAGSRVLAGFRPRFDATVVKKLREAGAIIVGKTVTHEFAYGQNVPETRNPWRLDSYPGGSSAGSGVAVAARSLPGAIGTDTGGSIRIPAAVNGIVGMKATYGRVSRYGCIPMSSSLDHVGPMARTVEDCAVLLQELAGYDPNDPCSLKGPIPDFRANLGKGLQGLRIGVDRGYFLSQSTEPSVRAAVEAAIEEIASLQAQIVEVSIPELNWSTTVGRVTTEVDTSAWHRTFLRTKLADYDPRTRLKLELGELIPATHYVAVQRVRMRVRDAVKQAFSDNSLGCLIAPTVPVTARRIEQLTDPLKESDEGAPGLVHHEYPANIIGLPALSVPCGFSGEGLPIGFQLIGRPLDESTLFGIGRAYEAVTDWHLRKPPLTVLSDSGVQP